ncbi:hypothetical protein WH47_01664 [Habropoda laboriosa]|uniref:Uncharacterized protein n=1 Tax=Habropoda laboriosa TaxID=597456 RepID=A0A0L7R475_9HYME|nr:hypothetical protein WH47_01664 [Habropoda laboriosa]
MGNVQKLDLWISHHRSQENKSQEKSYELTVEPNIKTKNLFYSRLYRFFILCLSNIFFSSMSWILHILRMGKPSF